MRPISTRTICFVAALALMAVGCSETPAEQRERLTEIADEVLASGDEGVMKAEIGQLDRKDLDVFSRILEERRVVAQSAIGGGSALTQRLIRYAAEDEVKANRLVADCEVELKISAIGSGAQKVAACVDQRW